MIARKDEARHSAQAGLTMVEGVLMLALFAVVALFLASMMSDQRSQLKMGAVASRLAEVHDATDRYVRDHFEDMETAIATSGATQFINPAVLVSQAYLPSGWQNSDPLGNSYQIAVKRRAAGVLEALVVAKGGQALDAVDGGQVVKLLKGVGGFVAIGSDRANGAKGSFSIPVAEFNTGNLPQGAPVAYSLLRKFDGPSGALMREDTGNPADNRMGTNLDMDFHDILNVANLQVGNTTINQTTVKNINDLAGINCANGEALTKMGAAFGCVPISGMPTGGIAAYTGACPAGWSAVTAMAGRFLVGAGSFTEAGKVYTYAPGGTGGEAEHRLLIEEMPAHNHGSGVADAQTNIFAHGYRRLSRSTPASIDGNSKNGTYEAVTDVAGGGQPFDKRPPYYAVNYCKKN